MRTPAGLAVIIVPLIMQHYKGAFLERYAPSPNRGATTGGRLPASVAFQPRAGRAGSEHVAHAAEDAAALARIEHGRADLARVGDGRDVADVMAVRQVARVEEKRDAVRPIDPGLHAEQR